MSCYPFHENPSQTLVMDEPKSYFFQLSRQMASDRSLALKVSLLTLTLFREYEHQQYTMILSVYFLSGCFIVSFGTSVIVAVFLETHDKATGQKID